jgi:hypothetical protein
MLLACSEEPFPLVETTGSTSNETAPAVALPAPEVFQEIPGTSAWCPPGMSWVAGRGMLGMTGSPYGIVETAHLEVVEAPEKGCEAALRETPGAQLCWVQTDEVDPVLTAREVNLEGFCIERYPFPGKGANYTSDGMTAWDAAVFRELLASGRYGSRRMCTFTEFQAAVASLESNHPWVYGDTFREERCEEGRPIGFDPDCVNPKTGVHEYGAIHSHWVVADEDFVEHACAEPPCQAAGGRPLEEGDLVVAGGTSRIQTRQAPRTPHTWHDHGEPFPEGCDAMGWDDQPVVCADPDPRYAEARLEDMREVETAWVELVRLAREQGQMSLTLEKALGRPVCSETVK